MKKKRERMGFSRGSLSKMVLKMKLLTLLMCTVMAVSAAESYSQATRFNLKMKNATVDEVFQTIEENSEFILLYNEKWVDLNRRVDVKATDETVETILDQVFEDTRNVYHIYDRQIVILESEKAELPAELKSDMLPAETQQPDQKEVTGVVSDAEGLPLPGVSVIVKGTTIGTITNPDGEFTLSVPADADTLQFSFVGMRTQDIPLAGRERFEITMVEETIGMEEVVVVGYGVQKKVTVTGSVSSVETEDIVKGSSASLANTLAGRMSGLTSIQSAGGQPGRDDATMYLRGAATTNSSNPLILIDGVPRDNIRTIDPHEVESISILKDASATALFGVRGANGVILITTRRGQEGKIEMSVNAEQSFSSFTHEPERLHSLEYMKLRNEAAANDGISPLPFGDLMFDRFENPYEGLDPNAEDYAEQKAFRDYIYPDHDYYRELFDRYVPQTRVNMNASGGTERIQFFVNAGFLHQGGNLNTESEDKLGYDSSSWMNRYNFRANVDFQMTESLKTFVNLGSYIERVNMPSAGTYPGSDTNWMMRDLIYQVTTLTPITVGPTTIPGFGVEAGQVVDPGYLDRSPFEIMNRQGFRSEVRSNLNSSLGAEWDLSELVTKGLSVKGLFSYDSRATTAMQGYKNEKLYLANVDYENNSLNYAVKRANESLLSIGKGADSRYNVNIQGIINYNRTFGEKHDVTGMFLAQRDYWETTAGEIPFNVIGIASRVTYAYDSRYLGEVNMGYNGSEQFAPGNRYGFFPAVSVGWVVSNENFMAEQNFITNLKLRASYGQVGNDKMGGARFLYQDNISVGGGPLGSLGLGQGINQGLLGNPNLSWELAEKQNYGIDVQVLNDLNVTFDYFLEQRSQILISRGMVPALQGVPLGNIPKVNLGEVDNQGFEVEMTYNTNITQDLALSVRGNFNYNQNEVKFMDEPMRDSTYVHQYRSTGYPLSTNWGYKIDYSNGNGFFNSEEELDEFLSETSYGFGTPRVGDFKYKDLNGDGVVNDKDQVPIRSSSIPGITYGLTIDLSYKAFDFMVFFQGVGQYASGYAAQGVYEYIKEGTYYGYHRNAWTPERYENGEKITYPALSTVSNTNHVGNDFFIMDRSFTRLKNIELGYTLPENRLMSSLGISNLRVYVSGQNLLTWENLPMDHLDPENSDSIGYPVTKMQNFGLDITF